MALDTHIPTTTTGGLQAAIRPGDGAYDVARQTFNLAVDQRPAAIAYPRDAAEVAQLVREAAAAGLKVGVQGGAHNAGPQGDLADALLIRTNRMDGVHVDPLTRKARVQAGVLWEAVVDAAAPHGLAALHGSSPDVGVVGYSLGGGLGWLARQHGLQSNMITAVELVTADGAQHRVDADHDPELFWALRGGSGNFGVVTALEFGLVPLTHAYAGWLAWDWTHAERVLERWAEWTQGAPDCVTTSARIMQLPPLPELPEPIRGRKLVVIDGAILGDPAAAAGSLAALRSLRPELDTFATIPAPALCRLHGDPETPLPTQSSAKMLKALPPAAVSAFVGAAGSDSGSNLVIAELRQLGGAVSRPTVGGATAYFDGAYLAFALGMAATPEMAAETRAQTGRVTDRLDAWAGGRPYLNFEEEPTDVARAYFPAALSRLRAVRDRVDPSGMFRANHVI